MKTKPKEIHPAKSIIPDSSLTQRDLDILYSKNLNYIHEPFWAYNEVELKGYAERILQRLKPLIVTKADIKCEDEDCFTIYHGKKTKLRKISQFGRVLPTLYLTEKLRDNAKFGVPRIFLVPKDPNGPVTFTFELLYKGKPVHDMGRNPLQVQCDAFDMYKENIEGNGKVGDQSFAQFGHLDFHSVQVIKSDADHKLYLIDTKEEKNFFLPVFFVSFSDILLNPLFPDFYSGTAENLSAWSQRLLSYMFKKKRENFKEDIKSIAITIPCGIHCQPQDVPAPPPTYKLLDFSKTNPRYLLRTAIKTGNVVTLKTILYQNKDISIKEELVPDHKSLKLKSPLLAAISNIDEPKKRLDMVRFLIENGAEVTGSLESAISLQDLDLINILLDHGEKPTSKDVSEAIKLNNLNVLKSFFFRQPSTTVTVSNLRDAVFEDKPNMDIVLLLLKYASQPAIADTLVLFLKNNDISIEHKLSMSLLLLENIKGKIASNLLDISLNNGNQKLLEKLFEKDIDASSVITFACYHSKRAMVDLLLQKRKLTPNELDNGIHSALTNFTSQVLPKLLALKPTQTPKADAYIDENLQGFWGDIVFDDSIIGNQDLVFDFLFRRLHTLKNRYFLLAIENHNMHALEKLLDRDFLKKVGVFQHTRYKKIQKNSFTKEYVELEKEELDKVNKSSLNYWLSYLMQVAFQVHNTDALDFIHKNFNDDLDNSLYWSVHTALSHGHDAKSVSRFLKSNQDYAMGLELAAEFGDVELATDLMKKLEGSQEEPQALDIALANAIHHLDGKDQKTIKGMIWERLKTLKTPTLHHTVMAAIESDQSSLELLKQIVEQFKPNLNFVEGFVTPLIKAIVANDYEMVKFLLEHGADANQPGLSFTIGYPLSFAILQFIKHTPSSTRGVRSYEKKYKITGTFTKKDLPDIEDHNLQMVEILVKHGANPILKIKDPENMAYKNIPKEAMKQIKDPKKNGYIDLGDGRYLKPERIDFIELAKRHKFSRIVAVLEKATKEGGG